MTTTGNPLFDRSTQTAQSLQYFEPRRQPNAKVAAIIQKLGLCYQPNSLDALDDHKGKIALLIADVDGLIPPDVLARVAAAWALKSPYMPKASDLMESARETQQPITTGKTWAQRCADANATKRARMDAMTDRQEAQRQEGHWWVVDGEGDGFGMKLDYTARAAA
jgi:hypothetical protein